MLWVQIPLFGISMFLIFFKKLAFSLIFLYYRGIEVSFTQNDVFSFVFGFLFAATFLVFHAKNLTFFFKGLLYLVADIYYYSFVSKVLVIGICFFCSSYVVSQTFGFESYYDFCVKTLLLIKLKSISAVDSYLHSSFSPQGVYKGICNTIHSSQVKPTGFKIKIMEIIIPKEKTFCEELLAFVQQLPDDCKFAPKNIGKYGVIPLRELCDPECFRAFTFSQNYSYLEYSTKVYKADEKFLTYAEKKVVIDIVSDYLITNYGPYYPNIEQAYNTVTKDLAECEQVLTQIRPHIPDEWVHMSIKYADACEKRFDELDPFYKNLYCSMYFPEVFK